MTTTPDGIAGLPHFVQVGPFRYTVIVDEATVDRMSIETESILAGHIDHELCRILVAPGLSEDVKVETLLHEVLHAVLRLVGLDVEFEAKDDDMTEAVVNRLAPALLDLFRRNASLVETLVG